MLSKEAVFHGKDMRRLIGQHETKVIIKGLLSPVKKLKYEDRHERVNRLEISQP